ncbi:probable WRKY transcription factor 2 [Solanum dulcamara]|uniref:probable WRKY transcription factor 2 n=1 Tax=Solanum dulcamara TaxID=45834 RepID=UPI002484F62B|nr:probable WRKY transcription factor 2 [Solanum dulcamara]
MGGFDHHVANIGDWIPPSPSPSSRAFFSSSLLADDFGGWQPHMEETNESTCRNFVVEPQEYVTWCNSDGKDGAGTGATTDQTVKSNAPSEQEMSSRGGLMERMVARAGFNVPRLNTDGLRPLVMSQNQEVKSPYLSIAAGLSPSILLYSPVLLYNPLVYPSPTTGLLPCATGDESNNLMLTTGAANKRKEIAFGSNISSSLSFNSIMETGRVNPSCQIEVSVHPNNSLQPQSTEATQNERICHETTDFPVLSTEEDVRGSDMIPEVRTINVAGDSMEHSSFLDEKQDEGTDGDASVEDGYNWRKYGQNQVKGSEYSRSYYTCTHPNCLVKKEIGRYHKGHVMEIIYNGAHNHPKPLPNRISALGSSNSFGNMQLDNVDPTGTGVNGELALETIQQGHIAGGLEGKNDNLDETTLADLHSEYCRGSTTLHSNQLESADVVDISSTFSNDEDDRGTRGSASLGCDGERDESESKIRKIELDETDTSGASKPIKEPRVVVQTISEIDIIDDGYRWRKYGQKMVKGNPYPRSYYKCTNPGCNIRKHIERAPSDLKSVITTYDGKHNHDAPIERKSSQASSGISKSRSNPKTTNAKGHVGRPEPTQTKNTRKRYGRAPPFGSFGPTSGFNSSETNQQQGLTGLAMTRFNSDQHQFSVPVNPHTRWPQPVNDAGFVLPEGEPMPDPSLNYSNASSTYQEVMNGLPPGPQM